MAREKQIVMVAFAAVAALAVFFIWTAKKKVDAVTREHALNRMMQDLTVGDSPASARQVVLRYLTNGMRLVESSSNAWVVEMPRDWTSTPANLYADFSTGRISRLRIRFQHDTNIQPHEAENDKR